MSHFLENILLNAAQMRQKFEREGLASQGIFRVSTRVCVFFSLFLCGECGSVCREKPNWFVQHFY